MSRMAAKLKTETSLIKSPDIDAYKVLSNLKMLTNFSNSIKREFKYS